MFRLSSNKFFRNFQIFIKFWEFVISFFSFLVFLAKIHNCEFDLVNFSQFSTKWTECCTNLLLFVNHPQYLLFLLWLLPSHYIRILEKILKITCPYISIACFTRVSVLFGKIRFMFDMIRFSFEEQFFERNALHVHIKNSFSELVTFHVLLMRYRSS